MKNYPEGTKARFKFKSLLAKSRYETMNPTNRRIVSVVGNHPFIGIMNNNNEWRIFDSEGKILEIRFGYVSNTELEMGCFNMAIVENPKEEFPEIKKELALVINDLRVTKDNYKEVVKFITDSFGE